MNIRPEQPGDVAAIRAVNTACFPTPAEADLVDQLRAAGRLALSLVADDSGEIVGCVGFSPVTAEGATGGIGLAPVAVVESHRRRGVAARLIRAGLAAGREAGFRWCVVLGEPAYYSRFGFQGAPAYGLSDAYGGGDAFQVVALTSGGIPRNAGLVRYCEQFAVFE